jgi:hypothetical protein
MRLIDADALIPMMKYATTDSEIGVFPIKIGFNAIVEVINSQPTIEPERKNGTWIPQDFNKHYGMTSTSVYYYPKCSMCGESANYTNFCPNCGADMRNNPT